MISQRERGELARFYTVTDPKKHKKGYTVYKVTARIISRKNPEDIQEIIVWKRYSDFRKLHQNLWQLHKSLCSQSELFPPFAKAKVFGRFDDSVIEERRQCSEDLLQFSANIPVLYSSQHIQDFFRGGEVHDGSDLIGPAEPFLDFLADNLSDCSSEVHRDISGADDLTLTSEYGGPSSDSDLTSLAVETDSLAELDDGMASGRTSPNQPQGGVTSNSSSCSPLLASLREHRSPSPAPALASTGPGSLSPSAEVSRPSRTAFFSGSLKRASGAIAKEVKPDYLDKAGERIRLAVQKETEQDYQSAFSYYRSGVDLLLQGVQGETSPTRREAVKKKTAEYLMRAEHISSQHLRSLMGQGSTQTVAIGAQCCPPTSRGGQQTPADELNAYMVLGVIDKVLLVMDKRTHETFILKGLRKSSDCGLVKKTVMPGTVPNMVRLKRFIVSEDSVFLLLQYAEGGKLWSHIGKFLHSSSPDDSFDIPFIQKSHVTAFHAPQHATPSSGSSAGPEAAPAASCSSAGRSAFLPLLPKSALPPGLKESLGGASSSSSSSECTTSYLTLCKEYEQDKVEPDALEEEERGGQEALDAPAESTAASSSRSRSLLSNDSLSSPISAQELRFFTEVAEDAASPARKDDRGRADVFSPLPSPVAVDATATPLPLDQSKRTPMEFFRIDSKDSGSELPCGDPVEPLASPKALPPSSASEVTEEGLPERGAPEVKGDVSVPVISFKEAAAEDEGQPPDLLVNLPAAGGAEDPRTEDPGSPALRLGLEAAAPPQKSAKPDVLQLHSQAQEVGEVEGCPSPPLRSTLWSDFSLTFGEEAVDKEDPPRQSEELLPGSAELQPPPNRDAVVAGPLTLEPGTKAIQDFFGEGFVPCARVGPLSELVGRSSTDGERADVSRLFAELDRLSLEASQACIPEEFVRCWAMEMVAALDALHQEGIVCKDLNPNNILLNRQGHVLLTYFCSWSEVEDSYDKEAIRNMYCAPEVGGIVEETAACDWWSLGAILFELLTGKSLIQCHPAGISRHTALNIPESVSEEASSLLEQLLQYTPTERLGSGVAGVDDIKSHPFFTRVHWLK